MDPQVTNERRQFSRVPFDADVLLTHGSTDYQTQLVDISLNGVLLTTPPGYHLDADRSCILRVILADSAVITMQATLVHSNTEVLGFQCTGIDMDSIIHLRRLIEINLGDPLASERVLAELLKRQKT